MRLFLILLIQVETTECLFVTSKMLMTVLDFGDAALIHSEVGGDVVLHATFVKHFMN